MRLPQMTLVLGIPSKYHGTIEESETAYSIFLLWLAIILLAERSKAREFSHHRLRSTYPFLSVASGSPPTDADNSFEDKTQIDKHVESAIVRSFSENNNLFALPFILWLVVLRSYDFSDSPSMDQLRWIEPCNVPCLRPWRTWAVYTRD